MVAFTKVDAQFLLDIEYRLTTKLFLKKDQIPNDSAEAIIKLGESLELWNNSNMGHMFSSYYARLYPDQFEGCRDRLAEKWAQDLTEVLLKLRAEGRHGPVADLLSKYGGVE